MIATCIQRWLHLFRSVAAGVLAAEPALTPARIAAFADESGHTRDTDGPFMHAFGGVPLDAAARLDAPVDVRLWTAVAHGTAPEGVADAAEGPLFAQNAVSLEVYTERLLSAMHAAHRLAVLHSRPDWWRRTAESASWLTRELQPDNATNHPWAIGVFAAVACESDPRAPESTDAGLFAQTLLSNCQVMHGRPSRLAAYILEDAARTLLRHSQAGW